MPRFPRPALLAVLAVTVTACSSEGTTPSTPPSTTQPAPAFALAYRYEPGDHLDYGFSLDQHIVMTIESEGGESLLGRDVPGAVDVTTDVRGTVSYDLATGPEPGTVRLSISGAFDQMNVSGTVDGRDVTEEMTQDGTVPDLLQVPDLTLVLDARGNIVSVAGEEVPDDAAFFGDPFSQLGDLTSGGLSNHFGPAFPDRELRAGESWSFDRSESIPGLIDEITVNTTYEVRGTETRDGHDYVAIDFVTRTSEIVIDLGEMFRNLFQSFGEMSSELGEEPAEIPDLAFVITVAPSEASGTIWFDEAAGRSQRIEQATAATIDMVMDVSGTDGDSHTAAHLEIAMNLAAELAGSARG